MGQSVIEVNLLNATCNLAEVSKREKIESPFWSHSPPQSGIKIL